MPLNNAFSLWIASVLALTTPYCIYGVEPPSGPDAKQSSLQESSKENAKVSPELSALTEAIIRLEHKVDRLLAKPSGFSPVKVTIVDEGGEPMSGFEVQLTSVGDVQAAEATGTSKGDGIGLERDLPYGRYRLAMSGNSWYVRDLVTVEVGKPLDLAVVAPAPNQYGELVLKASLGSELVNELPFGEWEVKGQSGWGTRIVPKPQAIQSDSDDWKTFPTVSDGIDVVAVVMQINIQRRIEQPGGGSLAWEWRRVPENDEKPHMTWLVQSDGMLRPLLKVSEKSRQIGRQAEWFQDLAPDKEMDGQDSQSSKHRERLGYHVLELGPEHHVQASIRLPVGQFELAINTIYGKPKPDITQAIDDPADSHANEIWLPGVVSSVSTEWLSRLLGRSWDDSGRNFTKVFDVAFNAKKQVLIGTGNSAKSPTLPSTNRD